MSDSGTPKRSVAPPSRSQKSGTSMVGPKKEAVTVIAVENASANSAVMSSSDTKRKASPKRGGPVVLSEHEFAAGPGGTVKPSLETATAVAASLGGTANQALASLVKGWENYMNDPGKAASQPLQLLSQQLQHYEHSLTVLSDGAKLPAGNDSYWAPSFLLAPAALRHTHSTPLSTIPDVDAFGLMPPPVPLDPFQRSSSTPSAFRQVTRQSSCAFSTTRSTSYGHSAFNPVQYYAQALEDMERTSIEVTDTRALNTADDDAAVKNENGPSTLSRQPVVPARGAASRAARFLSDVRVLRRRRRSAVRDGRENPMLSAVETQSVAEVEEEDETVVEAHDHDEDDVPLDTTVTVVTENINPADNSMMSRSSELSALLVPEEGKEEEGKKATIIQEEEEEDAVLLMSKPTCEVPRKDDDAVIEAASKYQSLQSYDESDTEDLAYEKIELQAESPGTVPSPSYQAMLDHPETQSVVKSATTQTIRIQMSSSKLEQRICPSDTPSPTSDPANASPMTHQSSTTGSSLGHTTHATTMSASTVGQQSGLSTISETDREVMEVNKEGKRRRSLHGLTLRKNEGTDGTSVNSSSTNSTQPHRYLALGGSPVTPREGAIMPADRFFVDGSAAPMSGPVRSQTSSTTTSATKRSGSMGSSLVTYTNSSQSSTTEEPPTFVSYFEREGASELTSVREAAERSSPRAVITEPDEEREDSPAEIVDYPDMIFQHALQNPEQQPQQPLDVRPSSKTRGARLDKFRMTRPPRSPAKGARPLTTPPPRGAVSPAPYQQLSPPRNIVSHTAGTSVSKPHVVRTMGLPASAASTAPVTIVDATEPCDFSHVSSIPVDTPHDGTCQDTTTTYAEGSIEILKTDSNDETPNTSNLVSP